MDALELLRSDHDTVRGLFSEFADAREAADTDRMQQLQQQIFGELETHTAIEEEVFYPASREVGGEAESLVDEGLEEHHVVEQLMGELRERSEADETWVAKMQVLIENVEHHAEEEEQELFPKLRDAFGEGRLSELGEQLQEAKQRRELDHASKEELYEQAQQLDIEGRSSMTKEQLGEAVQHDS